MAGDASDPRGPGLNRLHQPLPVRTLHRMAGTALSLLAVSNAGCVAAQPTEGDSYEHFLQRILDGAPISASQMHVQQTPIAARGDIVYIAQIEPGPSGDVTTGIDLITRLYRGHPDTAGDWSWESRVIERRTVADAYHTAPAVGIDETGRVHVAYNMHNFPWQYKAAQTPGSIDDLQFRGQAISTRELKRHAFENKTHFPGLGTADVPGNQITYPAFFNDRDGQLYLTYRFAAKPARPFAQRTMSSGVARFDARGDRWTSLGGSVDMQPGDHDEGAGRHEPVRAIMSQQGWTSYSSRLTFGPSGRMTVSSLMRRGTAGASAGRPCVVETSDGVRFTALDRAPANLPLTSKECGNIDGVDDTALFYTLGDVAADAEGNHHLLLSRVEGKRELHRWTGTAWSMEAVPGRATQIFFDRKGNLWALGNGLDIHVRQRGSDGFVLVYRSPEDTDCFPRAVLHDTRQLAYVYTMGCDLSRASVLQLNLDDALQALR